MTVRYDPHADWAREDRELAAEAARPQLETLVALPHEVWGWYAEHTHASVTELDDCEAYGQWELDQQTRDELYAENAIERYLEEAGYDEARLQEQVEAARGVISFQDAWDLAGR